MQEIKFRWVGRNRKFNEIQINSDLTIQKVLNGNVLSFFNNSNRGTDGNCEFLSEDLFSGFQDKKGVDIYRGDIVAGYTTMNGVPVWPTKGSEVKFENACFVWKNEPIGWDFDSEEHAIPYDTKNWAVVIGNIYQNPEFLT